MAAVVPLQTYAAALRQLLQAHPIISQTVVRAPLYGLGAALIGPAVLVGLLNVIGFGAAGVGAGSLAALIQSTIGNVAAGSVFAWAQGAAAGGIIVVPVTTLLGSGLLGLGTWPGFRR
ncbi:hypothetical protein R3P38DRAFT_3168352 [Favolaschia claudopus]|uniref:Uncharacterized protein n=1 Tax=Favolaschia claudopus TaxID=2862362 RepID=A0AAW0E7L9_9AGAR